jgi:NAD-dependent deacetylase
METDTVIARIAAQLDTAQRVLFVTGAGISADSGLPTYRGVGGLYNSNDTEDGIAIEDALSGDVFARRPDITWKYLLQIEQNCRGAEPNAAHRFIAALEDRLSGVLVLTQNVDGLHRKAGSRKLIEIHGGLHQLRCTACDFENIVQDYVEITIPPRCSRCGFVVRPDIVLFGEQLPPGAIDHLYAEMQQGFDMVFIIGTSAVFPYISQPVQWAAQSDITTVEINPTRTHLSDIVDFYLPLGASAAMAGIAAKMIRAPSL